MIIVKPLEKKAYAERVSRLGMFFISNKSIKNASNKANGKINNAACSEAYLATRDIRNGSRIPPIGIAILIDPITVPAISGYSWPAKVIMRGSMAEIEKPAKKTMK